ILVARPSEKVRPQFVRSDDHSFRLEHYSELADQRHGVRFAIDYEPAFSCLDNQLSGAARRQRAEHSYQSHFRRPTVLPVDAATRVSFSAATAVNSSTLTSFLKAPASPLVAPVGRMGFESPRVVDRSP